MVASKSGLVITKNKKGKIMEKKIHIDEVLMVLELPFGSYKVEESMTREEAEISLQEFKDLVKTQKRVLVKQYHPDLPKNGKDEEEKLKEILSIIELVEKLSIIKIQPRPKPMEFTMRFRFDGQPFTFHPYTDPSNRS